MEPEALREKLHKYIEVAEERKIQAIYTMLEEEISFYSYNEADIEMFHERREKHLKGETRSYSPGESLDLIRDINNNMAFNVIINAAAHKDVLNAYLY